MGELWVGGSVSQLVTEVLTGEPSGAATVGDDVGDWFAVNGQGDALAGLDGVDHLSSPVAQIANTNLHVRRRSTMRERRTERFLPAGGAHR